MARCAVSFDGVLKLFELSRCYVGSWVGFALILHAVPWWILVYDANWSRAFRSNSAIGRDLIAMITVSQHAIPKFFNLSRKIDFEKSRKVCNSTAKIQLIQIKISWVSSWYFLRWSWCDFVCHLITLSNAKVIPFNFIFSSVRVLYSFSRVPRLWLALNGQRSAGLTYDRRAEEAVVSPSTRRSQNTLWIVLHVHVLWLRHSSNKLSISSFVSFHVIRSLFPGIPTWCQRRIFHNPRANVCFWRT